MSINLPSYEECLALLREHKNPDGIIRHSVKVAAVAKYLAENISRNGIKVDVELVEKAALLHDIAKFISLDSDIRHGTKGAQILMDKGYPEIAKIVEEHALSEILKKDSLKSIESKLVYYADKRVTGNSLVSLDDRFSYLREKYGKKSEQILETINKCYAPCKKLEDEIFSMAKVPKDLSEAVL